MTAIDTSKLPPARSDTTPGVVVAKANGVVARLIQYVISPKGSLDKTKKQQQQSRPVLTSRFALRPSLSSRFALLALARLVKYGRTSMVPTPPTEEIMGLRHIAKPTYPPNRVLSPQTRSDHRRPHLSCLSGQSDGFTFLQEWMKRETPGLCSRTGLEDSGGLRVWDSRAWFAEGFIAERRAVIVCVFVGQRCAGFTVFAKKVVLRSHHAPAPSPASCVDVHSLLQAATQTAKGHCCC